MKGGEGEGGDRGGRRSGVKPPPPLPPCRPSGWRNSIVMAGILDQKVSCRALLINNICLLAIVLLAFGSTGPSSESAAPSASMATQNVRRALLSTGVADADELSPEDILSASDDAPPHHRRLDSAPITIMGGLGIPPGEATPLPSIIVEDAKVEKVRSIYGGKGDKQHLGGEYGAGHQLNSH